MRTFATTVRLAALTTLLILFTAACKDVAQKGGGGGGGYAGCFVHLYDNDDLDASDDNFRLSDPGRYGDLSKLPGSHKDWNGEADSLQVGSSAQLSVWSEPDFGGDKQEFGPGDYPNVDPEPRSLELSCS